MRMPGRTWVVITLALAGCGPRQEAGRDTGPDVAVTAAPGVAFDYRYGFRLPARRIAGAQEAHAQMCERLGVARCRITGMQYRVTDSDDIDASMEFKLQPAIARAFGKQGIAAIEAADGMLVDSTITGTDAAAAIGQAESVRTDAQAGRERLERELARPGLTAAERGELVRQRGELDNAATSARASVADQRESLARTPVTFTYETGRAIRGFDTGSRLAEAGDTAIASFQWTLLLLLRLLATLGPPALVLGALYLLWRRFAPRWLRPGRWRDGDPI